MKLAVLDYFNLMGKTAVVTGGSGLLGKQWLDTLWEAGAWALNFDIQDGYDITDEKQIKEFAQVYDVDILINNVCNNPQPNDLGDGWNLEAWVDDLNVGLTGAFLCTKYFGLNMRKLGGGVILNIGSDYSNIAPDQRIYSGGKKPASYSVVKHGLVGLTRWAATYFADKNIRVNCLSLGGVYNNQPKEFVERVSGLIPMGRMARVDEYRAALLFMVSDASSYMTGANVIIDGGRSIW